MDMLSDLKLKYSYHKGEDDIAQEFYSQCLRNSISYDRAVGFFSSSIYTICWTSLKYFIKNGGKMRFICSPIISMEDMNSLYEGYSLSAEEKFTTGFLEEFEELLNNPYLGKPARAVSTLVALGILDFKIAFLTKESGTRQKKIFHDKLGIFSDSVNYVVFKGSMNETWSGLSNDGNLESIDVFISWSDARESDRIEREKDYFNRLWDDNFPNTRVIHFPQVARQSLIDASDIDNLSVLIDEVNAEIRYTESFYAEKGENKRRPKPHQISALQNWIISNRRGIFQHATGSGKTFTGLCALRDSFDKGEVPLIIVPSDLLLKQWTDEIRISFSDLNLYILSCGGGNVKWRTQRLLGDWSTPSNKNKLIIATTQTASSSSFLKLLRNGSHLFLLADEVHRLGSHQNQNILKINSGPRLGLSATPMRAGDPEGSRAILSYFEKIVPPPFDLKDAIKSKVLTPYMYFIHKATLNQNEQEKWTSETREIGRYISLHRDSNNEEYQKKVVMMLIQRSRIIKNAQSKIGVAINIIKKNYIPGQRWIVYCDSGDQVQRVRDSLHENKIDSYEYQSNMEGNRAETFKYFDLVGGIIVAIRCLDEGVDIPSVSHALIMASSRNPREFIQRRGRVLRKAPNKNIAYIHDILITPIEGFDISDTEIDLLTLEGELVRALEFGENALNPSSVTDIKRIALTFNVNLDEIRNNGIEYE